MNEGSGFSPKISWLKSKTRTSDLVAFMDMLPQAALLVDSSTWLILHPNPLILKHGNYTRTELIGTDVRALFANWFDTTSHRRGEPKVNSAGGSPIIKRFIRHDQTQELFRVYISSIKNQENLTLIVLEPAETADGSLDQDCGSPFWAGLNDLFEAENLAEVTTALNQALSATADLSGADLAIVYKLAEGYPEVQQLAVCGNNQLLPQILSMQDLVALNHPRLWEPGKQPSCSLYRSARAAGIRYLASAPIGENTALVGLVLLASTRSGPPTAIVEITHLLATAVEAIFHSHIHQNNLSHELDQQRYLTRRLLTVADRVQEGLIQLSPELEIRSINPRMEQFLGYSSREVSGQKVELVLIGNETLLPALSQAQNGEAVLNLGDINLYRRDGASFQALVRIFPVIQENKVDEILVFIQDLSEKEQFRAHALELEDRAGMGDLMSIFAHDVRNPINNISTALEVMQENLATDNPQQASISRMLQDCKRLNDLVNSVLAFSKPMTYKLESLDLGLLLQRVFEKQRDRSKNPNIRYEFQIEPNCPRIMGNHSALEQVFTNLITNAVQAMDEKGGLLSLKVQPGSLDDAIPYVEASVTDTGPGIPPEVKEKLFLPFFTTKQGGSGLGLSIAKRIITTHKGDIQCSSFIGGTIFKVRIPAIETQLRLL